MTLITLLLSVDGKDTCFNFSFRDSLLNSIKTSSTTLIISLLVTLKPLMNLLSIPNSFNLKLKKGTVDEFINDQFVGKSKIDKKVVVQKQTKGTYPLTIQTSF